MSAPGLVTLTTDFGTTDPYVGAMKGVLLSWAPGLSIHDITHDIPPQDVLAGSYALRHAATEFPDGTVHVGVVDPGVGSERRALVVDDGHHRWVGPDNGLFTLALSQPGARAFRLDHPDLRRQSLSATFHGRDLFSPAAAAFATGFPVEEAGIAVDDPVMLAPVVPLVTSGRVEGTVIHIDRFGNAISCIHADDLDGLGTALRVQAGELRLDGLVQTYADVEPGAPAALLGSGGLLEIVVRDGPAAERFGLHRGDTLSVETRP